MFIIFESEERCPLPPLPNSKFQILFHFKMTNFKFLCSDKVVCVGMPFMKKNILLLTMHTRI